VLDTIIGAAVEIVHTADSDREWFASRPDRSISAVRDASRVPARFEAFARCVLRRESGATLERPQSGAGARNPSSSAAGRWQFMSPWAHGGPYMVRDRLIRHGATTKQARKVRIWLSAHPINTWPGVYQDTLAFEVMERGGAFHWRGPGCAVPR
jgi:hypothetical protein